MGFVDLVDVFHGNQEYELPEPEGAAASWFFLKAQTGNTHPGAALPFGAPSVCPYSGGYPTGYSPYWYNTHSRPERIMDSARPQAAGFSHFHHSGTGAVGFYYNYLILSPRAGSSPGARYDLFPLENEEGSPGYYRCTLGGIPVEIAGGQMCCAYRIRFSPGGGSLILDPELNGIFRDKKSEAPPGKLLSLEKGPGYAALVVDYDFPLAFHLRCSGAGEGESLPDGRLAFRFSGGEAELFLGFSFDPLKKDRRARENAVAAETLGFEGLREASRSAWEAMLQRVEIDAPPAEEGLFYSCLYHSLAKPCDLAGDSPFKESTGSHGAGPAWVDFATMWDGYKAQFPLIFTLYDQPAASMTQSLIAAASYFGYYPNCLGLREPDSATDMQARALGWHSVYDAFVRGVEADYSLALDLMEADLRRPENHDFREQGRTEPYPSHTWDLSCACFAAGLLARALGKKEKAESFFRYAANWPSVLDPETGLMTSKGRFYEGSQWNYSFRLLPQTIERIAGKEGAFVRNLDAFFGYGAPPVRQNVDPRDSAAMKAGEALNRFEGFNNETDMESPYAYIYAGRHDRTAEISRLGMKAMFAPGRGGICGNDDSGGLSAMYLCNTLGLFPASGLPYLFIGSPGVRESRLSLRNGRSFTVRCGNYGPSHFYVAKASLNGRPLRRAWIMADELMAGGVLDLEMSEHPVPWDTEPPPAAKGYV